MCSLVLVTGARYEFLPVNLLILFVLLIYKQRARQLEWRRPLNAAMLCCFAVLLAAWAFVLSGVGNSPIEQVGRIFSPPANFLYQLGERNFGVISGYGETLAVVFVIACGALALAGGLLKRQRLPIVITALGILAAWAVYFSCIYKPLDEYPLHFMRHQLYFFVPFACLFALGLSGLEEAWPVMGLNRTVFFALCGVFLAAYGALNLRAALRLNPQLRTNDRELQFLASARAVWPKDGELILYPCDDHMTAVLRKYFPVFDGYKVPAGNRLFVYRPARSQIFSGKALGSGEDAKYSCGVPEAGGCAPWLESSFVHRFYTVWNDVETREPRRVKIGFYMAGTVEKALALNTRASRLLREGQPRAARLLLEEALKKYPYCGLCRYNLATALLLSGSKKEAIEESLKAIRFFPSLADKRYLKAFLLAGEGKDKEADKELNDMLNGATRRELFELAANLRWGLAAKMRGNNASPELERL